MESQGNIKAIWPDTLYFTNTKHNPERESLCVANGILGDP